MPSKDDYLKAAKKFRDHARRAAKVNLIWETALFYNEARKYVRLARNST